MPEDGKIVIGTTIDDSEFYKKIKEYDNTKVPDFEIDPKLNVEKLQKEIFKAYAGLSKYKGVNVVSEEELTEMQTYISFIDKANERISELGGKKVIIKGLNDGKAALNLSNIEEQLKGIGNSVEKVTKKVLKWGLAVFGIRSAYMLVRNAMSTISNQDAQLSADIQYMKNALAYAIEPLVRTIVNLARQLMYYVANIVKFFTGKNIFENANKSLKGANKEAKQLSKTMAGFDEMNVVNSTSSTSDGGEVAPSFDLTELQDSPKWLNGVSSAIAGIVGALSALKIWDLLKALKLVKGELSIIKALGIGTVIAGIVYTIQSLLEYIKDPSWSNFGNIITGIGIVVVGLGMIFLGLPGIIAGVIVIILGIIAKFWDKINEFLENLVDGIFTLGDDIMNWIDEKLGAFGVILNTLVGTVIGVVTSIINAIRHLFDGLFSGVKQILDGIIQIFKGNFKEGIVSIFKGIANIIIGVLNVLVDGLNAVISPIRGLIVAVGKVMGKGWTMDNIKIPNIPKLAKGGIINMPGRGVPVGSAIGGERGQEGVIPLTDSQQMDLLGASIAKHMIVNLTNITQINGRTLSRELKQLQNELSFATNG